MPIINILKKREAEEYDTPPQFNSESRKRFFYFSKDAYKIIDTLKHPTNKIGYILQHHKTKKNQGE